MSNPLTNPADPSTATPGRRIDGNRATVTTDLARRAGEILFDRLAAGLDLIAIAIAIDAPISEAGERQTMQHLGQAALETARAVSTQQLHDLHTRIAAKLERHRTTSTRIDGAYKNPVREGYDRGLSDALALIDEVTRG